ncbi:MAG: PAS domain S-box protein, partial [Gammaproteobacteria bacterium]|nr:PAS domain S-box protein [Gammaproteobacteria bacterium]
MITSLFRAASRSLSPDVLRMLRKGRDALALLGRRTFHASFLPRFLAWSALSSIAVLVAVYWIEHARFELERRTLLEEEGLRHAYAVAVLTRDLEVLVTDLKRLAYSQVLQDYLRDPVRAQTLRLQNDLLNLVEQTAIYDQVRLLDASGHERIRVNFNAGQPFAVPESELQDKSKRYYFRAAMDLEPGRIYLSRLDLNVENGEIELPHKPTIRAIMRLPAASGSERQAPAVSAVLVLNYRAEQLLHHYQAAMASSSGEAMLLNEAGYWLHSEDSGDSWGFMLQGRQGFAQRYPRVWRTIAAEASGSQLDDAGLFLFTSVQPNVAARLPVPTSNDVDDRWLIVTRIGPERVSFSHWQAAHGVARTIPWLILACVLLALVLAWLRALTVLRASALLASEQSLAHAQRLANLGSWTLELSTRQLTWSDQTYRIFGMTPDGGTVPHEWFIERVHPEERSQVESAVRTALDERSAYSISHRVLLPDGRVRYVHERAVVELDRRGEPVRMVGTVQDVTDLTQADLALRASESKLRELFEHAPDGIVVADPAGAIIEVNSAGCALLGQTPEALRGRTLASFLPNQGRGDLWRARRRLLRNGVDLSLWELCGADGRCIPVEISAKRLPDGCWQLFVRDTAERKRTEEHLRQAAIVFDSTREAILVANARGEVIAANRAYTRITGYEQDEILGRTPRLHQSAEHDRAFYTALWDALHSSGQWQGEIWNRRKDGTLFPAWESINTVRDEDGRICNYVAIMSDISPLKAAEQRLAHIAHHDMLTGLSNRVLFNLTLEHAIERARRHEAKLALLFMDLDRFKLVNDTLGHDAG